MCSVLRVVPDLSWCVCRHRILEVLSTQFLVACPQCVLVRLGELSASDNAGLLARARCARHDKTNTHMGRHRAEQSRAVKIGDEMKRDSGVVGENILRTRPSNCTQFLVSPCITEEHNGKQDNDTLLKNTLPDKIRVIGEHHSPNRLHAMYS